MNFLGFEGHGIISRAEGLIHLALTGGMPGAGASQCSHPRVWQRARRGSLGSPAHARGSEVR
jgi:hypothetical protein